MCGSRVQRKSTVGRGRAAGCCARLLASSWTVVKSLFLVLVSPSLNWTNLTWQDFEYWQSVFMILGLSPSGGKWIRIYYSFVHLPISLTLVFTFITCFRSPPHLGMATLPLEMFQNMCYQMVLINWSLHPFIQQWVPLCARTAKYIFLSLLVRWEGSAIQAYRIMDTRELYELKGHLETIKFNNRNKVNII